jgi:hypothetical protein
MCELDNQDPTWDLYLSEPEPREGAVPEGLRQRQERVSAEIARGGVDADFDTPW